MPYTFFFLSPGINTSSNTLTKSLLFIVFVECLAEATRNTVATRPRSIVLRKVRLCDMISVAMRAALCTDPIDVAIFAREIVNYYRLREIVSHTLWWLVTLSRKLSKNCY